MNTPNIIIDVHGGDNSPHAPIEGAINALNKATGFNIILIGKEDVIKQELSKYTYDKARIQIVHTLDSVDNTDKPTQVIREKKDSSMISGLEMLKVQDDCIAMISTANTGAYLAGGTLIVGRIKGVYRPPLAALLPTLGGNQLCICDAGANVDSKPEYINQYAILASCYMRAFMDIPSPRVGLLNNGTEDTKGSEVVRTTHQLLKQNEFINFYGNMEGRNAIEDVVDIIVADGMLGNVLLKSIEGTAITVFRMLKNGIMKSGITGKLGALLLKKTFNGIRHTMDYQNVGGAPLLGLNKIVMKAHGSSKASSICQSVLDIKKMHDKNMINNIKETIANATNQQQS